MGSLKLVFTGLILGIANVIPGVSGGTIAVIFGIYERLLALLTINIRHILSEWRFWVPLGGGIAGGIILFSRIITLLFERFPIQTAWSFIGIVAGSIPMLWRMMRSPPGLSPREEAKKSPPPAALGAAVIALGVMLFTTLTLPQSSQMIQTDFSIPLGAILFAAGILGAIAMLIPGISGSFFLVVIGAYQTIIAAVSAFNIPLLVPTALGIACGLLCGAKLIRLLMEKAPFVSYGAIFGLVAGSVVALFPGFQWTSPWGIAGSLVCLAAGFLLSFLTAE